MSFYFLLLFLFLYFSLSLHMHYIYKEFMCAAFFKLGVQLLYNIVLVSVVQESESAMCIHISLPLGPHSQHPLHPSIWVSTGHQAEFPALYRTFPLATCLTHGSEYVSVLIFQFILPSPQCPHIHPCL